MQPVFKAASAAFALIPGISIMLVNLGLPPDISSILFGGIVEAMGVCTLLILTAKSSGIKRAANNIVVRSAITMFVCFLVALFLYFFLFDKQVIITPKYDPILFPFWPSAELTDLIREQGTAYNVVMEYGRAQAAELISRHSTAITFTKLIFCALYLLIFELLILSFGILGVKLGNDAGTVVQA